MFDYAMEKSTVKVHPDDREKYLKGFSDRMQGKHLNERFEYRLMTGKYTCSLFSAYGQIVQDEQGDPALLVLVAENHGISDEIDSVTGLYSEEVFDEHINDVIQRKIPAAILKVGIEQFSRINVLYGVEYANRVLSEVTYLLRCAAADQGFVYRLSGAKFALVFKRKNKEQIQKVYHFIQDSLSDRLYINDKKVPLRIAGGAFILENYTMDAIAVRSRLTYEGVVSIQVAMRAAEDAGLDLVKIAPQAVPPVCKVLDYGKYRFEQQKKEKEAKKNQKVVEVKETRLSLNIDTNDFNTKLNQTAKFLAAGHKVKVSIRFRGREMAHSALGADVLKRFAEALPQASMDKQPVLEGRTMSILLIPKPNKD